MLLPYLASPASPLFLLILSISVASAQVYPSKPIRIVTAAVGGGSDFASRLIAQGVSGPLGQPVIVENRPTFIAIETVAKAPPDGYTVFYGGSTLWISPFLQDVSWDPLRDFTPVVLATVSANTLVVHPSLPVNSVKELIAFARARPGALNYGAGGSGSTPHLTAELFKLMAGVDIVRVPYKGVAQAVTDLISGQLQVMFPATALVAPHVASGRLKALAVTSAQPTALLPGLPTVAASGLPGFVSESIDGIVAPAKTPAAIVNRLNQEVARYINTPEAKQRFLDTGVEVVRRSPEEFAAAIKSDMAVWGKIIKDARIRAD
jgi:tripartite-type tricarboxylate transporter receptor subunit TctC